MTLSDYDSNEDADYAPSDSDTRLCCFGSRRHSSATVVLKFIRAGVRIVWCIVCVLIGVVVRQCHLAKLLLGRVRLSSRFQMWFGRILNSRSKLEAEHRDDRVDDEDNDRRLIANNFNVLGTSPPSSSCSALDRGDRDSADQSQSHLNWPVAGHILCGD